MAYKKNKTTETRYKTILNYRQRINAAVLYADENWGEQLDINLVAKAASYSPYHFHRVFTCFTGETLANHIRKVRMKKSAAMLLAGWPVTEIAVATGFGTTSAFSRCFRQTTGLTPTQFKDIGNMQQVIFRSLPSSLPLKTDFEPEPRIVQGGKVSIYYLPTRLKSEGLLNTNLASSFREAFDNWSVVVRENGLEPYVSKRLGVIRGLNSLCPEKSVFDAGIAFNRKVSLGRLPEIKHAEICEGRWAVFLHQGPYTTLWQTWNWIYNRWIRVSGYRIRTGDAHEVYLNDQRTTPPCKLQTEIYIPIE